MNIDVDKVLESLLNGDEQELEAAGVIVRLILDRAKHACDVITGYEPRELLHEAVKFVAEVTFHRYRCLVDAGFTEEQAFAIIMKPGDNQLANALQNLKKEKS